jgi:hypothetical protein
MQVIREFAERAKLLQSSSDRMGEWNLTVSSGFKSSTSFVDAFRNVESSEPLQPACHVGRT